jgi:hypothetical protein
MAGVSCSDICPILEHSVKFIVFTLHMRVHACISSKFHAYRHTAYAGTYVYIHYDPET